MLLLFLYYCCCCCCCSAVVKVYINYTKLKSFVKAGNLKNNLKIFFPRKNNKNIKGVAKKKKPKKKFLIRIIIFEYGHAHMNACTNLRINVPTFSIFLSLGAFSVSQYTLNKKLYFVISERRKESMNFVTTSFNNKIII